MTSAEPETVTDPGSELAGHRGRERWRRIWHAAFGAAAFRAVSIVGTLVTVPIVLGQLGDVRFGALMVVTQLATLLVFSDLGLGNGLVTSLAGAIADDDERRARALVSSTWFLLSGVALAGLVAFFAFTPVLDWGAILGITGVAESEVTTSVTVFAVLFLIGVPASIAQKIHLARQEGWQANAWQTLGALLTIGATVTAVALSATLPWFVAAGVGGSVVSAMLNSAWLFLRRPDLRPRRRDVDAKVVRFIFGTGALFLVLGVASAVAYQTDALVIAHILGPAEVTPYNIALRMFMIPGMAVSFLLAPLWPAFSDAFARHDRGWVRQTLRRAILWGAAINVPGAFVLVVFGQELVDVWVGEGEVDLPSLLLVAFAVWTALNAVTGPLAMLLNGAHVVAFQVACAVAMVVSNVALSIAFTHWLGVAGPVLGSVVAQSVCITVPSVVHVARMLRA